MSLQLIVVRAFGTYPKGGVIADPMTIAEILGDDRARNVVRVNRPAPVAAPVAASVAASVAAPVAAPPTSEQPTMAKGS